MGCSKPGMGLILERQISGVRLLKIQYLDFFRLKIVSEKMFSNFFIFISLIGKGLDFLPPFSPHLNLFSYFRLIKEKLLGFYHSSYSTTIQKHFMQIDLAPYPLHCLFKKSRIGSVKFYPYLHILC